MTRRRFYPLVLCAFLATTAVLIWNVFGHETVPRGFGSVAGQPAEAVDNVLADATELAPALSPSFRLGPTPSESARADASSTVFTLSDEATSQLAEQIELNGLAEKAGLALTSQQLAAFAEVTSLHQAIREAYEAGIASLGQTPAGHPCLEIPLYSTAGDALRATFYAALREAVGESLTEQIASKVGPELESRFAGFGVAEQTVELVSTGASPEADTLLQRTLVYWNALSDADHLATRRETYLSALEETEGRRWSAFRSLLSAASPTSRL